MIIRFNKKTRDELVAIKNYINEYPNVIDEVEFMDFIISYEYYPVYYQNYHIFRDLINYHNIHFKDKKDNKVIFPDADNDLDSLLGL